MSGSLEQICTRYNISGTGAIHIGAHTGEERPFYKACGFKKMVWVEANPTLAEKLKAKVEADPELFESETVLNVAVANEDRSEVEFHVASNQQSSSLREFGTHSESYPEVTVTETIRIPAKRLDTLFLENPDLARDITFANLDIQGCEYEALQGLGKYLDQLRWIYSEVNYDEVYRGNVLVWDIDKLLLPHGFVRRMTSYTDSGWGEALYIRRDGMGAGAKAAFALRSQSSRCLWLLFGKTWRRLKQLLRRCLGRR